MNRIVARFPTLLLLASMTGTATAQNTIFLSQGKIEYERRINQYAQMEERQDPGDNSGWAEISKKFVGDKFKTDYFNLLFTRQKTLYKPGRESPGRPNPFFNEPPAQENVVYADLGQGLEVGQKSVFGHMFLLKDTLRRIHWKITDEMRVIAGFNCRRANAIIMDSIYVVAFYTDEILTPGGPEGFSGLPGMILGVALPHEHITWFATRVEAVDVGPAELNAPVKGNKVNNKELLETINSTFKDWGREGAFYLREIML
ncbi:MAG TPA: GLPGLI family protein [Puia sp.]|nr:GLPGLI family protein [Puia sp.]